MLRNTFCHVQGIGLKSENRLWTGGVLNWDDAVEQGSAESALRNHDFLKKQILESYEHYDDHDVNYFSEALPTRLRWRMFPDFRADTAYLDIETSGGLGVDNYITTIAVYDGRTISCYVRGDNLHKFRDDMRRYKVLVTYNGSCFDVPFIQNYLGIEMNQAQIDLRFVLASMGFRGGLKGCEKQMGLDRHELDGLNGYAAVLLWNDFRTNRNRNALETLIAYNILDAVNLEHLMVMAYNLKLKETPFGGTHSLPLPQQVKNPYTPHQPTVERIKCILRHYAS